MGARPPCTVWVAPASVSPVYSAGAPRELHSSTLPGRAPRPQSRQPNSLVPQSACSPKIQSLSRQEAAFGSGTGTHTPTLSRCQCGATDCRPTTCRFAITMHTEEVKPTEMGVCVSFAGQRAGTGARRPENPRHAAGSGIQHPLVESGALEACDGGFLSRAGLHIVRFGAIK